MRLRQINKGSWFWDSKSKNNRFVECKTLKVFSELSGCVSWILVVWRWKTESLRHANIKNFAFIQIFYERYLLQFDRNDFLKVNKAFWRAHFLQIWTICLVWLNWNSSERSIKATSMSLTIWIGRKAKNKSEFGQPKINNSWIRFSFAIHLMRIGAILLLSTFLKTLMKDFTELLRSLKAFLRVEKIRCIFAKWKHKMTHSWGSMNLDKNVWMERSWFAE